MGCGASSENEHGKQGQSKNGEKSRGLDSDNPTAAYPNQRTADDGKSGKYIADRSDSGQDSRGHGSGKMVAKESSADGNGETVSQASGPLSQSMLVDLRSKSAKEGGSSVQRWVDSITSPSEVDAPDVYDPLRRHFLSMDSLNAKSGEDAMVE